ADALRRRRVDPFELDPTRAARWQTLERLREVFEEEPRERAALAHPDRPLLAALVIDATADEDKAAAIATARRLVHRLGLGAGAEEDIAFLLAERDLLARMAARPDALDEEPVRQLAAHLRAPEPPPAPHLSA